MWKWCIDVCARVCDCDCWCMELRRHNYIHWFPPVVNFLATCLLGMKEKRDQKSTLVCDRWEMRDEVTSNLVRGTYSRKRKCYLVSYPRMSGMSRLLSSGTWRRRAGKRPKTGISPYYIQERCSNDNGTTSFPFSDRRNPNEAPRLPSPSHGNVACCVRKCFNFVGYGRREVN